MTDAGLAESEQTNTRQKELEALQKASASVGRPPRLGICAGSTRERLHNNNGTFCRDTVFIANYRHVFESYEFHSGTAVGGRLTLPTTIYISI